MNADHDRDRALDQALKAALGRRDDAPITPACLDGETLAAWIDGGLDAQSVAMAEAHAANCVRCQAMLGTLARATPAVTASGGSPVRLWRWWLAPLAAGAAAVTLWMVVPTDRYSAPPQKAEVQVAPESQPARERDAVAPPTARLQNSGPAVAKDAQAGGKLVDNAARKHSAADAAAFDESKRKAEALMKQDKPAERGDRAELRAPEEQASAKVAAPAVPPPAAPALGQLRAQIAMPSGVQITTSSSPSSTITWFVGRAGVVLLTTDGRTVTRVPFPEATDLTAVDASDARIAVVTTIDGRIFRTDDGGKTWRRSAEL